MDAGNDHRKLNRLDAQIRAIRRFGKLPSDLLLRVESPRWGTRVLTIESLPGWISGTPRPVQVPAQLRNPHPAVAALRDADHLPVDGPPRTRTLRLLQALAAAATAQGYRVTAAASAKDLHGRTERAPLTSGSMYADMTSGFTSSSRMTGPIIWRPRRNWLSNSGTPGLSSAARSGPGNTRYKPFGAR